MSDLPDDFRPRYGGANWAYDMGNPMQFPQPTIQQMVQAGLLIPGPLTAIYGGAGAVGGAMYGARQLMSGARLAREFPGMGVMGEFAKEAAKGALAFPAMMGGMGYAHDVSGRLMNWSQNPDAWNKILSKQPVPEGSIPGKFNYDKPFGDEQNKLLNLYRMYGGAD